MNVYSIILNAREKEINKSKNIIENNKNFKKLFFTYSYS